MPGRGAVQYNKESHSNELLKPGHFLLVNEIIRNENTEKNVDVDTSVVLKKTGPLYHQNQGSVALPLLR